MRHFVLEWLYLAKTQMPGFENDPDYIAGDDLRRRFLDKHGLIVLRPYQLGAIHAIQAAAKKGTDRYLLEMATGTGKTKTTIALAKLFLSTGNAKRILFLVDRIELEEQAYKDFSNVLKDWHTVIYKKNKQEWQKANIVITTVQSLLVNNRYRQMFDPADFDLVVSDEAHRSIGGNARAVFEYFIGYKIGLTATPKDYLKHVDQDDETTKGLERRQLLDTYKTFGCDSGEPTYRYDLVDGARDGFLIQPYVIDARTDITTELLSKQGLEVERTNEEGVTEKQIYYSKHFEKKFFNNQTNWEFCKQIIENGERDPITGEFGKTLVFCKTQKHAVKVTQILNEIADKKWAGVYNSDFALQVTSNVDEAQMFTTGFTNNNLRGKSRYSAETHPDYNTSKTRICVTVGMMTTGYDCPDLLNIVFMRPIFSPADFIQMKGRGTRTHTFKYPPQDLEHKKTLFKLFDFFAVCAFFESEYVYNEKLKLPPDVGQFNTADPDPADLYAEDQDAQKTIKGGYDHASADMLKSIKSEQIGIDGMRVDREVYDKPNLYITGEKVKTAFKLDRLPKVREIIEYIFGDRDKFDTQSEIDNSNWNDFYTSNTNLITDSNFTSTHNVFTAYTSDTQVRQAIDAGEYGRLDSLGVDMQDWSVIGETLRSKIPVYAHDFVLEGVER
jgi:type I restriction enzyme, R subunit